MRQRSYHLGMDSHAKKLVRLMRAALRERAEPAKAEPMRAYMKSEMPFLGVQKMPLRAACREVFAECTLDSFAAWSDATRALWREARYREERYAAIELADHRVSKPFRDLQALPLYEEMIVSGAWWDLVDPLATRRLAELFAIDPARMARTMRRWAGGRDIWKRRSAIISQLKRKQQTDLQLLFDCIEPSLGESEFFLRKAIGWALREHAKTDPAAVRRYVEARSGDLSPLSRREALKNLD